MSNSTSKEKQLKLLKQMESLGIKEDDLTEKFVLGTGSGGQKINKTSSCVYLHHIPSGIMIKCQQTRSRELNRYYAREELCNRIVKQRQKEISELQQAKEKKRRQNRRPSFTQKIKMVEDKRYTSKKKSFRRKPHQDD
jgi:peptide chain release factor